MSLMGLPLWAWIVFYVLVLLMLVADLKMFGKKGQHEVNVKEALQMTAVWIGVSLVFCAVIETTDVAFAVDSIPAVFSVSRDPFIVLTSNIFAILGLRALYFALAAVAKYFTYIFGVLVLSMLLSVVVTKRKH